MCAKQNRSIESLFHRPAAHQSRVQCTWEHSGFMRPISYAQGSSAVRDKFGHGRIVSLFCACRPMTIAWLIVAIVIDSVNHMFRRWTRSHVFKEVLKCLPSRADSYATPAVSVVADGVFVRAAFQHSLPDAMFRSVMHAVPSISAMAAPSTPFASKVSAIDRFFFSACAAAQPESISVFCGGMIPNDSPKTELLASQVYETGTMHSRINRIHQKNLLYRFGWWIGPAESHRLPVGPLHYSVEHTN